MKKLIAMICAAVMAMALVAGAVAETPAFTTIEPGKLLISTSPDFPPFESTDDNDNIIGIEPEIMALVAEKLGLVIEYMPMDFTSALAAAQTGRSVRILDRLCQPADHAVNIYHPEGEYLKGLLLYVE